ncbi:MAG: isoprenylcysteine carboxylmethyltransferase family protein [Ardenticatenaceae bacterium]|nr:isoprenylcysteine carboxylmethyltransferase family protein [Ardenticatenaceae bacterium]MCB9445511.1 isoprenylcysteine carboxylmethyltransferase family protein [Ardenticatenaceae bacterium]
MKTVFVQGILSFLIGVIVIGVLLSLIAGTFAYWNAWVFAILFNFGTASQGVYLFIKDPELLERRKQVAPADESLLERIFIILALLSIFGMIIFSAVDHRFGWSHMSLLVMVVGDILVSLSFIIYYFVFMENSFAASSVRTFEEQRVISTGPYAIVRHPKYVGDILLITGIPLALGSWWGLIILGLTIPGMAWRILDEEKLLKQDLPGYLKYMENIRYRLIPYIW